MSLFVAHDKLLLFRLVICWLFFTAIILNSHIFQPGLFRSHSPMQTFEGHTDQVYNIEWAPHNESILASSSADRRAGIWELSRIAVEQTPEDA